MIVTNISVSARMSRQVPSGEWITVELGAEAAAIEVSDLTWQEQQAQLFQDLRHQMGKLVKAKTPPAHQAPPAPQADRNPQHFEETLDTRSGEIRTVCPDHKISRDSRHGGLFCPGKDDQGNHCTWTHPGPSAKNGKQATRG